MLLGMSSPDADLRGRVEQLEADRDNLYVTFRAVDGEFHEALARHRADRTLMSALRATQIEQGEVLGGLVVQMTDVQADVTELKTDVTELKSDVTELRAGQRRMESMLRRVLNVPETD
jgi:outer membrane murein-binding lipoprotein Lpp